MSKKKPPIVHDSFTIERTYDAEPARVFAAWADPAKKRRWFVEGEGFTIESYEADFREGGLERSRFRHQGGPIMTNDTFFHDIVPDRRIISSYDMTLGGERFSVSLSTLEIEPEGRGTRLRYTEQGAYFGSPEDVARRKEGCGDLLQRLAEELGERT